MKLITTYLLTSFIILQSFGLNMVNVANFSNLISHYQHHKIDHQDSFLEFIDLHYGSQKEEHSDQHDEHQDLPFHEGFSIIASVYFTLPEQFLFQPVQTLAFQLKNFNYVDHTSLQHTSEILQPPKNLMA